MHFTCTDGTIPAARVVPVDAKVDMIYWQAVSHGAIFQTEPISCRVSTAVVQRFCKPKAGGSIPSPGTIAPMVQGAPACQSPMMIQDQIPDTTLFDRARQRGGYQLNKMAMGLGLPANRAAFRADERWPSR